MYLNVIENVKKLCTCMLMSDYYIISYKQLVLEEALSTRDKEIEMLQEKISLLNIQQMKEVTISMYYII